MRRSLSIAFVFSIVPLAAGLARPSEGEQRMACMSDAVKLCFWDIPDRHKIEECMASKHDQLSPGCAVVFDASRAQQPHEPVKH